MLKLYHKLRKSQPTGGGSTLENYRRATYRGFESHAFLSNQCSLVERKQIMIPSLLEVTRNGSLGGEEVSLSFDEDSIAHIMGVLTDLYSDSAMAVIREYSTNAYDSHVEAGQTRPIEVTLPTPLRTTLKIQDWGVGLSREQMISIYSKYGASTKRDTNEQSGTLGLGCKSALTHAPQFTVVAVKNGIKTTVSISRAEDGSGLMELIDSVATRDDNGVTVEIPVKFDSIVTKAHKFFSFWKPGTVLVDGKEPTPFGGMEITPSISIAMMGKDYIVMGNVPYPVAHDHRISTSSYYSSASAVAYVPIGAVDFTPNREELRYTKKTRDTLETIRTEFMAKCNNKLNAEVQAQNTAADALAKYVELNNAYADIYCFKLHKVWRGQVFDDFDIKNTKFTTTSQRYSTSTHHQVRLAQAVNGTFILGFNVSLSARNKAKIRKYVSAHTVRNTDVIIIPDDNLPCWFDNADIHQWNDIKTISLSDTERSRKRGSIPLKILRNDGYFHDIVDIDDSRPIYYVSPADDISGHYLNQVFDVDVDQVISISRNRWGKLLREYPTAKTVAEGYLNKRQELLDNITQDVLDSLMLEGKRLLRLLDENRINDPELSNFVRISKIDTSQWVEKFNVLDNISSFGSRKSNINKYVLFKPWHSVAKEIEHFYIYANAVYEMESNND